MGFDSSARRDYFFFMNMIRQPAVAGAFYPGDPEQLRAQVREFLAEAERDMAADAPVPKAIVVPHAGYVYSGAAAARAFARLKPAAATINRVVLLGPCHRVAVGGLALSGAESFATPLGDIPIDGKAAMAVIDLPQVVLFEPSHMEEHSLEVQLPFLQEVLGDFKLLPLAVGDADPEQVAQVLEALWGGPETLIVISTDLSHFLDDAAARRLDGATRRAVEALAPEDIGDDQACGRYPLKGFLTLARRWGMRVETLALCNSGDAGGGRDRVVGYGTWAFFEQDNFETQTRALLKEHGGALLKIAAASIGNGMTKASPLIPGLETLPPALAADGACFVTLKLDGELRGCIGTVEARRPLAQDVAENAFASAFRDPRFPPVTPGEMTLLEVSISVLGPPAPMTVGGEEDLLAQLRPGIDGLIIEDRGRRALFLPSVWKQLPDPRRFLDHLKAKAGMPAGAMTKNLQAWRFITAEVSVGGEDVASLWA